MKSKTYAFGLFVVILTLAIGLPAAFSQDDITELQVEAFGPAMRPAAVFAHDAHNEKAGLTDEDCAKCHHVYENGVLVEDEDSAGEACADCHDLAPKGNQPGLRVAYHKQCKSCHVLEGKGALACGQCHVK